MGGVIVLGSLNIDLVTEVPRLPRPGETVAGGDLRRHPGGKGANQAVAAARAGARVRMVGACGADDGGELVLGALVEEGVDVAGVRRLPDVPTGTATILVEQGGENMIAIGPGANAHWDDGDAPAALHGVTDGDVLLLQLEVPAAVTLAAARVARRRGATVVLNAAPLHTAVPGLLDDVDVLVVNEHEVRAASGVEDGDPTVLARDLAAGASLDVVVTLGARGAVLCGADGREEHVTAPAVEARDTVGAGDTFAGYLAAALAEGRDHSYAVRRAVTAASLAVTRLGAQTAIPRVEDLPPITHTPEEDHATVTRK
ncbi:ribokinase [Nocardioides euryhalodurans]|nr:ribokinase [Nocardioides euryhalodurans]